MSKTIFLTGAGGMLGREFLRLAVDSDLRIIALSSQSSSLEQEFGNRYEYLQSEDFLRNGYDFSDVDVLLHCAFPRNNDSVGFAKGLDFQKYVFETAINGGVGAVANISSQSVYDSKRTAPADENTQVSPENRYAVSKYMSEQLLEVFCCEKNVPFTNLRMASLIGLDFHVRIINRFVKNAIEKGEISVNAGYQSFGFLDVRDAAAALFCVVSADCGKWEKVYNIGAEREWGIAELAELAKNTVETYTGNKLSAFEINPSEDRLCSALDCTRFMSQFSWKPRISIKKFTQELVEMLLSAKK